MESGVRQVTNQRRAAGGEQQQAAGQREQQEWQTLTAQPLRHSTLPFLSLTTRQPRPALLHTSWRPLHLLSLAPARRRRPRQQRRTDTRTASASQISLTRTRFPPLGPRLRPRGKAPQRQQHQLARVGRLGPVRQRQAQTRSRPAARPRPLLAPRESLPSRCSCPRATSVSRVPRRARGAMALRRASLSLARLATS